MNKTKTYYVVYERYESAGSPGWRLYVERVTTKGTAEDAVALIDRVAQVLHVFDEADAETFSTHRELVVKPQ